MKVSSLSTSSRALGVEVRAGVHTGEVQVAEGDLRGVAVHLAARVMAAAGPNEVFVSGTSTELASGAGVEFLERGIHELKGISGRRQLYEARRRGAGRGPG